MTNAMKYMLETVDATREEWRRANPHNASTAKAALFMVQYVPLP